LGGIVIADLFFIGVGGGYIANKRKRTKKLKKGGL